MPALKLFKYSSWEMTYFDLNTATVFSFHSHRTTTSMILKPKSSEPVST